MARAIRALEKLESGTAWISPCNNSDYRVPFGGAKISGIGKECGERRSGRKLGLEGGLPQSEDDE